MGFTLTFLCLFRENVFLINIFFKDLNFELIEQVPAMTESQLFGKSLPVRVDYFRKTGLVLELSA